ncbi:vacuolar protein sorting-associated protein 37A-like [Acanthaster planci]|uniref:Vacuolar protein sorting-associated protein 37A-like n=1 Tax=Acanthaster planci TaxID=133434 RepID=A0A8B7Y1L0_ACAPL|nr:vacuolar protein sorting-associated protein 37A-like [Acanthaster planci]
MSWLFGSSKSNLPPITPLQEQRSKQIESLKNLNPNVVELKRDVEYRVTFSTGTGATNIALHITLPPQFPQEKPLVKVSPPLRHPWVSNTLTVVGCPGLNNFGVHTDLGRVIQSIIQEMRTNQPFVFTADPVQVNAGTMYQPYTPSTALSPSSQYPVASQPPAPGYRSTPASLPQTGILLQGNQPPAASLVATQSSHLPGATASATQNTEGRIPNRIDTLDHLGIEPVVLPSGLDSMGTRRYSMPSIPLSLKDNLSGLSSAQLQEILDSEEAELKVFSDLPQVKRLLAERHELYDHCEQLAQANVSYQPELEKLKNSLRERLKERNNFRNRFDMNCLNQQRINEQFDLQLTLDHLRVAAAEAEHESEAKAEAFLEGRTPIEEFLREYLDLRKTMHLRRAKEEKLDDLLKRGIPLK